MGGIRNDLEGRRYRTPSDGRVWLILLGLKCWIASPTVFTSLFRPEVGYEDVEDLSYIRQGVDLIEGTCLVSSERYDEFYLVTRDVDGVIVKCLVQSLAAFEQYGFDQKLVRPVPSIIIDALPSGGILRGVFF